jgi:PST family polysaccharide transporter
VKNFIKSLKEKTTRHKVLIENFSYLSALQLFNMALPLLTYPYLARVLGLSTMGLIAFAQALVSYFMVIINYGFNISATRYISINRKNKSVISNAVNSVYLIKSLLFVATLIILVLLINIVPKLEEQKFLYLFSFGICFNELLFPIWYFQGVERMKFITIINLSTRLFFLLSIFLFVHDQTDYLKVPILNGIGALGGGLVSIYLVYFID